MITVVRVVVVVSALLVERGLLIKDSLVEVIQ
jgi:hypothetical protein